MEHWMGVLAGILLIFSGYRKLILNQEGEYWGFPVPTWVGWIFIPIGLYCLVLSVRAILRGKGKPEPPKVYTNEDAKEALAKLDAMYLREHGKLPEKPEISFLEDTDK